MNAVDQNEKDAGTIEVLMERFTKSRLPRAQRMLARVSSGEALTNYDINWLKTVYEDSLKTRDLVRRHPRYHKLISQFTDLYAEITAKALENEKDG